MIDEHDRCKWVNVSFGTGSPGCPGENPENRKMVVCVCVVSGALTYSFHSGLMNYPRQ